MRLAVKYLVLFYFSSALFLINSCKSTQATYTEPPVEASPEEPAPPPLVEPIVVDDPGPYRGENTRYHDLIHTKLEVRFDWEKQYLNGTALLELKPHFYTQNQLELDAKGFDIKSVKLVDGGQLSPLDFDYNGKKIVISLDRNYQRNEHYFVEIEYTAKPNELDEGGSEAITSDKGLYFINPTGSDKNKPQQIWTQGETEASSCWFPTIDSPNQRTTQEIYITVREDFVTLSNGQMVYSRGNNDGTRTDYWKMDQPHAPYLFMMAIGDFAIVKDQWQGKEVSYYVEPAYEKYADAIFGNTPEMMTYFSELLNYPYPWSKYSQVVVRDYVSGAMENTTASIFMEDLQVDTRYLLDDNWDGIIAHELFHQWFGDLVTCESWSNLTMNEAFATYSEYLWAEHHLGRDEADHIGYDALNGYLQESIEKKVDLIRFHYDDKEDMFDNHSYAKGSSVLHMLRAHLGDEAFFETLHQYLTDYAGQAVEVHHLRLAAERVSGQDLNWFFNQWFLDSGHPELQIQTQYQGDSLTIIIAQVQDLDSAPLYKLPLEFEYWQGQKKTKESIVIDKEQQTFIYKMDFAPDAVIFDPDNWLLAEFEYQQTKDEIINQFRVASSALTRYKALERLLEDSVDNKVVELFYEALDDPFWSVRQLAVNAFQGYPTEGTDPLISKLRTIAKEDEKTLVRADAITILSSFENDEVYLPLYMESLNDSSYAVAGAGLTAYLQTEHPDRTAVAEQFEQAKDIQLVIPVADYHALNHTPGKYPWFEVQLDQGNGEMLFYLINYFGQYLTESELEEQLEGARYLENIGINHSTYYIRYSAFQSLGLLDGVEEITQMRKRVRDAETDPRLLEIYAQYP